MKNNELMKKISDSLFELAIENNLSFITKLVIEIDLNTKIKENELFFYLLEEMGMVIGLEMKLILKLVKTNTIKYNITEIEGFNTHQNKISIKFTE